MVEMADRLLLAGLRPSCPAAATSTTRLHLGLLGNLQRIVDLDPGYLTVLSSLL
jgi:hypothetical protein